MKRLNSVLLVPGIMVPILYYGSIFIGASFYPGYSHISQYASELGSASAKFPQIFNIGIILMGLAGIVASLGFYLNLKVISGKKTLPIVVAILIALFGLSMVMGGMFPMPDVRHGAYGIGMGIHLVPALIAIMLWKNPDYKIISILLVVNTMLMIGFFAVMMGVGQLVTRANVGLFQRSYSLTLFPWFAIVSYLIIKRQLNLNW